nr:MAG TPA: hypothetical protein [Caudoviricetes sp.]
MIAVDLVQVLYMKVMLHSRLIVRIMLKTVYM